MLSRLLRSAVNIKVLHGSQLQKRTCNEPESRVALTSHDRSAAQTRDLRAVGTRQYRRQVPRRKNYGKFDRRRMWPGGSFTSLPEAFLYKAPFLAQWPWRARSQTLIFCKLLCLFDLFQHTIKAEMGTGASPTDTQDKHPDATSSCALWTPNQLLLGWLHSGLPSKKNRFLSFSMLNILSRWIFWR